MSAPARSDGSAGSAEDSALAPRRSSDSGADAIEPAAASGPSAVPPLPSSPVSSSASTLSALLPAAAVPPSVTVEDESTKRCSACSEDRPVSAFSSAQLKKKGKRVCHSCVNKRDAAAGAQQQAANTAAAATRQEAMKDTFAVRLNSAPTQAATACLCCSSKAAVRFAPCIRCTVDCCSLKCFDRHDCDLYLEAKRTMPTELIPEEDRFHSEAELTSSWQELFAHLLAISSRGKIVDFSPQLELLNDLNHTAALFTDSLRLRLTSIYVPRVCSPWWSPSVGARLGWDHTMQTVVHVISTRLVRIGDICSNLLDKCANDVAQPGIGSVLRGSCVSWSTTTLTSACFLPCRLLHKLLTLLRFVVRTMGSQWAAANFDQPGDVSSDAFGLLPTARDKDGTQEQLGYLELPAPDTGLRTLVPLCGTESASSRFCIVRQHLGQRMLLMVLCDGQLLLDRGLYLSAVEESVEVLAVTGCRFWTGNTIDAFSVSPIQSVYWTDECLCQSVNTLHVHERVHVPEKLAALVREEVNEELEARKRPDYFHIVLAIKQMIPEAEWPRTRGSSLFIATPQRGIESELTELSLLESLAEDAAAGDERAQLLLSHIEAECAAPIAEVIARQKSRLDQMLEDQAAQLRIHAEAVKRAEMRGRIRGPTTESEGGAEEHAPSASVSSSSASALAPTSAASSSSFAVSSARASSSLPGPAYSWTQSREYLGLESLREPGRKKYSTIMSAAKRLLYSLRPVSVNKRGGSHIVFHFASGAPATLVQLHTGSRSKDNTAPTTRLFAQLSEVAAQQGMAGACAIEGAAEVGREGAGHRLLN